MGKGQHCDFFGVYYGYGNSVPKRQISFSGNKKGHSYGYFKIVIKILKDINFVKTARVRIINSLKGIMAQLTKTCFAFECIINPKVILKSSMHTIDRYGLLHLVFHSFSAV